MTPAIGRGGRILGEVTRNILKARLRELLDDGTGKLSAKLLPLFSALAATPKPDRAMCWISNNPHVGHYLQGLARGHIPLTHQGLNDLESWRTATHLRDLLMHHNILPRVDRHILLFERWQQQQLSVIERPEHARLLRQFTTWHQLPRLHATARQRPVAAAGRNHAAGEFTAACRFLNWLAQRGRCAWQATQADIDSWHVEHPKGNNVKIDTFFKWAMTNGHMPPLNRPRRVNTRAEPISHNQRLTLLRRVLTEEDCPLRVRVAACLVLLYAQPIARIVRLTVADVTTTTNNELLLRLGDPPTPVPAPFADLLLQQTHNRTSMNTANNPDTPWLFPGQHAGQPLTPGAFKIGFGKLGIPTIQARTAAFRQLIQQAPAPVIAQALGYHAQTAHKHLSDAGATWNRYPATRNT